jgi:ATP-dependent DNA helicase RecG
MSLTIPELQELLDNFRRLPAENEIVEFKEAKRDYSFDKIGMYFSALANEANLKGVQYAWLIFGIENKQHGIVGTDYRNDRPKLDSLKHEIAEQITPSTSFVEIYELGIEGKRVVMFQIPASLYGVPTAYKGHYYAREGESLVALGLDKIERIRMQGMKSDWSAGLVPEATIDDLDPAAISKARENYGLKFPDKAEEAQSWDITTFLNKAKLTIRGKITRTVLILLGREEVEHFLSPADVKIRWVLKDLNNQEKDYETFSVPLLLAVEKVNLRIRNLKYRYMKEGTLFPEEVLKYEPFVIREALNNCIALQDYEKG